MKTYTYDPSNAGEYGIDRMRFELGDVMVEGRELTSALCDEEYRAVIPEKVHTQRQWKKAKLACLESVFRRFSYEPDMKEGPLSLSLGGRAELWQEEYEKLKQELEKASVSADAIALLTGNGSTGDAVPPYFYNGMMSTEESEGKDI